MTLYSDSWTAFDKLNVFLSYFFSLQKSCQPTAYKTFVEALPLATYSLLLGHSRAALEA